MENKIEKVLISMTFKLHCLLTFLKSEITNLDGNLHVSMMAHSIQNYSIRIIMQFLKFRDF